jgi:hypothetical protein
MLLALPPLFSSHEVSIPIAAISNAKIEYFLIIVLFGSGSYSFAGLGLCIFRLQNYNFFMTYAKKMKENYIFCQKNLENSKCSLLAHDYFIVYLQ